MRTRLLRWAPAMAAVLCGCATTRREAGPAPRSFDLGPLASRVVESDGTVHERALGPLLERVRGPAETFSAVRPLAARGTDENSGWDRTEILWPLASAKRFEDRLFSWRAVLTYYQRFDVHDPQSRWRLWVLPFYFQGRDAHGQRYAALFPIGGRVHEILGQDEAAFVLFPLWIRSRVNEVATTNVLWPVVSRTRGKGIRRDRIFPFYGEIRHRDQYAKRFILWPIWTEARYDDPRSQGSGFILFPLYGRIRLTDQRTDLVLPPFIRIDRAERVRSVVAPWPFVRLRTGEVNETTIWPLFRTRRRTGIADGYVCWPLFSRERIDRGGVLIRRHRALPFVQTETRADRRPSAAEDGPRIRERKVRLWPLVDYQRNEDHQRFRFPALWPISNPGPVERNWAPLWTLVEVRADGPARDTEVLWGVYRRRTRENGARFISLFPLFEREREESGASRWSVLKGLAGVERSPGARTVRVLYLFTWARAEKEDA